MWLTNFALKRPVITAMFFIGIAIYGFISYRALGVSMFPNVSYPAVFVIASYPGASPSEIEKLIIKPIEDQLDGMENLDRLTANAQEGSAFVEARFKLDTDLNYETIDVQRRVDQARIYMPTDLDPPQVAKFSTANDPILIVSLASNSLTPAALGDTVVQEIVPALKTVPGVQDVQYAGTAEREFHVFPNPGRLLATGVTLEDINNAISANNANLPGGRLDSPTRETTVSIHADIGQASDLALLPLAVPGQAPNSLRVGQVAAVEDGHVEQRSPSRLNGLVAATLYIQRANDADELKTTAAARAKLLELQKHYPAIKFTEVNANADFTRKSIDGVMQNLLEGVILTAIVMLLFLHAWRNAVVVMIAIPTSLLATFIVMRLFGYTLDIISLMGLGLTIGILVDDSIVVLENITRHRDMGESPMEAAYNGRTEIGQAALTITLVDVVVFLPIAFLSGLVGKYMHEFGMVIVVATLFSLLVSFTLTPLLAGRWSVKKRTEAVPGWARWFQHLFNNAQHWYATKALPAALDHRLFVALLCGLLVLDAITLAASPIVALFINAGVAAILAIVAGAAWLMRGRLAPHEDAPAHGNGSSKPKSIAARAADFLFVRPMRKASVNTRPLLVSAGIVLALGGLFAVMPKVGGEFLPQTEDGYITGTIVFPVGTPLATTDQALDRLGAAIMKIPDVKNVTTTAGVNSSDNGADLTGGGYGQFQIVLNENKKSQTNRVASDVRKLAYLVPGASLRVAANGGNGTPIAFTLTGPDAALNVAADKLVALIAKQKGAVNALSSAQAQAPRLTIRIDPIRAAAVGVAPGDAALTARLAIGGGIATKVRTENKLVNVLLQLPVSERNDVSKLESMKVRSSNGTLVPLSEIADFSFGYAPTSIDRQARQRVVNVTAGIDQSLKISQGDILAPIQKQLDTPGFLPEGVRAIASDDTDLFNQTFSSMALALMTSFLLVYALMVILYGSFIEPFIVMFSVPVAIIGALVALSLRGQTLNLFSLIAVIMLFGLVAKNGILLVDYANQQLRRGLRVTDAIKAAAATRFRPIIMTTCAMVFGMLPLALGLTEGAKSRSSMGTVLIGGLTSSLVLTLVLVPVIYTWVMTFVEGRREREERRREASEGVETEKLPEFVLGTS